MLKERIFEEIDRQKERLCEMADTIFDHPECDGEEMMAADLLCGYLAENGFSVERPIAGLKSAFRAVYHSVGNGAAPRIGLLCEYDALAGLGHGCGHHMQGPACLGAAVALKNCCQDQAFTLVVYGTPAEETFGGKINMMEAGYLKDIDVALMMHGGPDTCTDIRCLALSSFDVTFHGKKAHAAIMPEEGRSAFDALLPGFPGSGISAGARPGRCAHALYGENPSGAGKCGPLRGGGKLCPALLFQRLSGSGGKAVPGYCAGSGADGRGDLRDRGETGSGQQGAKPDAERSPGRERAAGGRAGDHARPGSAPAPRISAM